MSSTNIQEELSEIRFQKEALLESDSFSNPVYREGLESLAQIIQNLIIIEQGTYPNQPELGVGIANYMFEILDDMTLLELQTNIENQIDQFINHPYINVKVSVQKIETLDKVKSNTIAISVILSNVINNTNYQVDYLFAGKNENKKIISKLYLS